MNGGVKSGEDGGERGPAKRRGDVAAGVSEGLGGKLVDARSFDDFVAGKSVVGPGLVIGEDEDDVGFGGETELGQADREDE